MKKYLTSIFILASLSLSAKQKPNIVLIYADDLGYGDISANGATKIKTPNIDKIAAAGLNFSNVHASSSTCTPSRYSILTGKYAWRQQGTKIAPGDAALIIPTNITTLPGMLQKQGYKTAAVGKWHLGLGEGSEGPNWNGEIKPGPMEVGFSYDFIMPATGDRVPCVYIENRRIVNLNPSDPISVNYKEKVGNYPTGKENPELLKMNYALGHDNTIVNGISRIGWMGGGKDALWTDEDMAATLASKAVGFMERNKKNPFFLYFATHDIHVPHVPHSQFLGKSGLGLRGDAILQLDWQVGKVLRALDSLGLTKNTIVILSSDNGPAIEDGYEDGGYKNLNGHTPAGPYRGGKYSSFEAGTRVPFIIKWPGKIAPGKSSALLSQVDLYTSFAALTGYKLSPDDAPDSFNLLQAFLGKSKIGRSSLVEHAANQTLGLISGNWKYISPANGPKENKNGIETGNDESPQLYRLDADAGERKNLAAENPIIVKKMQDELKALQAGGRSRK
ncbi:MAG: arylsulfatase [Sphingobacteriaceae bacterium]|jgi:arylsulfatase A-like enzyme|nr:arylsulfatase [Sphingobacteriaceae bacterium]